MIMLRQLVLLSICLVLVACVNLKPQPDSVVLYVLGPSDSRTVPADEPPSVYVARPDLPTYLEGSLLQYRQSDGAVKSLARARWAEPLQEGVARALSEFITLRSGHTTRGFYPWPPPGDASPLVRVRFYRFGGTAEGRIRISASWRIESGDAILAEGIYEPADEIEWRRGEADSLVEGLNTALEGLAAEIAASL